MRSSISRRSAYGRWVSSVAVAGAGVATTVGAEEVEAVAFIKIADDNLYRAKKEGRNKVIG